MPVETVFQAFAAAATAHPANAFLIVPSREGAAGVTWRYGETLNHVMALSAAYAAAGYRHGHRVALLLEQRPEFIVHFLALNRLGIGIVPINPDYRRDEMAYQMSHSDAELAVVVPHRIDDLVRVGVDREAAGGAPLPVIDGLALSDVCRTGRIPVPSRAGPANGAPGLESEVGLLYTSGTTGRPKGCQLSNLYYLTAGAEYANAGDGTLVRPGLERFYNPLPLFHMNHQAVTLSCAVLTANAVVLTERFSPQRWWREVAETRATIVHYLGIVAPTLLNQTVTADEQAHQVRFGVGAGIEPDLHGTFEQRFGFPMIEVWGMTETGRLFWNIREPRQINTRAFGRPTATLQARVVDSAGVDTADDVEGELLVRHSAASPRHGFFSGYLKNEAATEEAWRGGWFHTGDSVRRDASGMLMFVDRMKNIIRRSGENIAAAEVEAVLQAHAAVAQVAVIAAPDEVREEEVFACIVAMPGVTPSADLAAELFAAVHAKLAYYKAPGYILFVDTLPTTGTQKVQKTQIFPAGADPRQQPGVIDLRARKKR